MLQKIKDLTMKDDLLLHKVGFVLGTILGILVGLFVSERADQFEIEELPVVEVIEDGETTS